MRERFLPIFLLSILIFQSVFSFLIYELGRNQCYLNFSKSIETIRNKKIHTFSFSKNDVINWENENKEFLLNNKLYDVISIQIMDSSILIKCLADTTEDHIVNSYFNSLDNSDKSSQNNKSFHKFQDLIYLKPDIPLIQFNKPSRTKAFIYSKTNYTNISTEIVSPPPKNYLFSI